MGTSSDDKGDGTALHSGDAGQEQRQCASCGQDVPEVCEECGQELLSSETEASEDESVIEVDVKKCDGYEFELQRDGSRRAVCKACNREAKQCPNCEDYYDDDETEEEEDDSEEEYARRRKRKRHHEESDDEEASDEDDEAEEEEDDEENEQ